jgi:hypothetical protein
MKNEEMMGCPGVRNMSRELGLPKQINITIKNKLRKEKRDINVYHHSNRSAHIVSSNSTFTSSVKPVKEKDYLHISVVSGPGYLKDACVLDFPSFINLHFWSAGEFALVYSDDRILLRIPPGPPTWQLKMTISTRLSAIDPETGCHIVIRDGDQWPDIPNEDWEI